MSSEELQAIIFSALESTSTREGVTLYDKFNNLEVADFVNQIMVAIPFYPEFIIEGIRKRVFDVIPDDIVTGKQIGRAHV